MARKKERGKLKNCKYLELGADKNLQKYGG